MKSSSISNAHDRNQERHIFFPSLRWQTSLIQGTCDGRDSASRILLQHVKGFENWKNFNSDVGKQHRQQQIILLFLPLYNRRRSRELKFG